MVGLFILFIVVLAAFIGGWIIIENVFGGLVLAVVIGVVGLLALSYTQIEEGHVGVPVTFGTAKDQAVGAGIHLAAPWTTYVELNTREQIIAFEGDSAEREAQGLDDISMQVDGGGSFDLDARISVTLPVSAAVDVWRELGEGYVNSVVIPSGRECLRDASLNMALTDAISVSRPEIATLAEACLEEQLTEPYGIIVNSVKLGGTTLPAQVAADIDEKQGAEQARQTAEIELQTARVDAEREAVEALATSNAEQIIACGGTVTEINGESIVVPNAECTDTFSDNYLDWLFINNLDQVDNLVIVDPRLVEGDSEIILDLASASSNG